MDVGDKLVPAFSLRAISSQITSSDKGIKQIGFYPDWGVLSIVDRVA